MRKPKSSFSDTVRDVVRTIKKGEVLTYAEVARKAGSPKAYRAVASIMAKNYDHTVPCHRVIRTDGGLGGYNRGGVKAKRAILESEGVKL
jgi:O-6-methylguanine DNA methyltransferase